MRVCTTRTALLMLALALGSCAIPTATTTAVEADRTVANGVRFQDVNGNDIWGNGGCMIQAGDYFYWYGEHRDDSGNFVGVACYRSRDMVNWEFRGDVVRATDSPELNPSLIERPKVIYNAATKKYVLWAHKENANWDYGLAKAMVAYGDKPDEPFEYVGSFRPFEAPQFNIADTNEGWQYWNPTTGYANQPLGFMARDCTLFVDDDGTGYFLASSTENVFMRVYRLTPDYLSIDTSFWPINISVVDETAATKVYTNRIGRQREAPCLFKRNGVYVLVTSGTNGWAVTQTQYHTAPSLSGPWTTANLSETALDRSQPAFVFTLKGKEGTSYLYMGDRWGPAFGAALKKSQMVWAPLVFTSNTTMTLTFSDALIIDAKAGTVKYPQYYHIQNETGQTFMNHASIIRSGNPAQWTTGVTTPTTLQQWRLVDLGGGAYQLRNRGSGLAIATQDVMNTSYVHVEVPLLGFSRQTWYLTEQDNGYVSFQSASSGLFLTTTTSSTMMQATWGWRNPIWVAGGAAAETAEKETTIKTQRWRLIPVDSN